MKTIQITHKSTGRKIDVNIEKYIGLYSSRIKFTMLDGMVEPEIKQGQKVMTFSGSIDKAKSNIESFFGIKLKKNTQLHVGITDESFDSIMKIQDEFNAEVEEWKNDYARRASKMPTWYEMYEFLDWGDYTINLEREIRVYRKPLPEDSAEKMHVVSYELWNMDDKQLSEEWKKDYTEFGNGENCFTITEELANKWIKIHAEIQEKKRLVEEEKKRRREEKSLEEEKRRQECFEKAKNTGEKVILYSIFLTGSDIPRNYRDDDSDMGNLITYAMPDGSTKEVFIHAY